MFNFNSKSQLFAPSEELIAIPLCRLIYPNMAYAECFMILGYVAVNKFYTGSYTYVDRNTEAILEYEVQMRGCGRRSLSATVADRIN